MNTNYSFPKQIIYLFWTYLIAILLFFVFRLAILPLNYEQFASIATQENGFSMIAKAFFMGFRFDSVIASYVISPVLISFLIAYFFNIRNRIFYKVNHYFLVIVFSICFLISSVDIPYFKYFFSRFNVQALTWLDSPMFVVKMIIQEPSYVAFFFVFLTIILIYAWLMLRVYKSWLKPLSSQTKKTYSLYSYFINSLIFVLLIMVCFLAMRGRIEKKSPIKVGTAYFSNNALINQMGLNPVFTFVKSVEQRAKTSNKDLNLMDKNEAKAFVEAEFERMRSNPIAKREVVLGTKTNVVLVIMESMGTCNIGYFGNKDNLTPYLDTLLRASVSYQRVYTAGIHTYNGVYSTLFGRPALMDKHSMNLTIIPNMSGGLPNVLKQNNYRTLYFTTHDDQFDNVGGFLSANGFERIISEKDYPKREIKSTLGVPDHIMFEKAIREMDKLDSSKPFFATLLTASNHGPYILPEDIDLKTKSKDIKDKMIEYSDWAIGNFIQRASSCKWFSNTLFVFIADHGAYKGEVNYELPLSYHHTPLIFYFPSKLEPKKVENIGLQIDVPALIYSYLGVENKETLGIDFEIYPRSYGYFSYDDKLGVIDDEFFYIWNKDKGEFLYKYVDNDKTNYIKEYPQKAKQMQRYAFSMLMF
jgi:phosphoglycerol transferase MdoB-like AlkP superfamily enzyme